MRSLAQEIWSDDTGTSLPVFLLTLPFGIAGVFLPLYARELGATGLQVGALFTAFSLAGVLARPLVGLGADRVGRRPFILCGAAMYALASGLFALSFSLPVLFAARMAQGVGSALFWVGTYALLADLAGTGSTGRGRVFGGLTQAAAVGAIIGTVAGYGFIALLGLVLGWRVAFAGFACTTLLSLALLSRRLPRTRVPARSPVVRPAHVRRLLFLLLVSFVTAVSYSLVAPVVLLYLRDQFAASELVLGLAYAPAALVWFVAPKRLGALGDRWSRKLLVSVALLSSAVASLLFPLAPSLLVLSVVWVFEAAFASAAIPAQDALVSEVSGGDVRGRAYGFYAASIGLGAATGPPLGGWLYDHAGHSWPFWINATVLCLAAAMMAWKLPSRRVTLAEAEPNHVAVC